MTPRETAPSATESSQAPGASLGSLERYRPLVDDWEAFRAALSRPLPTTVWANTLRESADRVAALLAGEDFAPERLGWCPGAFRLRAAAAPTPGRGPLAAAGVYHIQEEVSLLPVELLDPRPGERVLDLCAAPGGKTARIAVAMENRGTVVANDVDWRRLAAVGRNLDRLGLVNVAATAWDAANFPEGGGRYDRVLADVPCTCEGTSRKNPGVQAWGGAEERRRTVAVQTAILRKALRLCRPGGRVVYSTCTYAPEENEAVVAGVLREAREGAGAAAVRLLDARVEGFRGASGLEEWQGRPFGAELERALRVWPHAHDTGGFFVAVLEVGEGLGRADAGSRPELHAFEEADRQRWLAPVLDRFGLPEEPFEGLRPVHHGGKSIALIADDLRPPARPEPRSCGLAFLHATMRDPKLATAAAMAFGARARRNVVDLERGRALDYLGRRDLPLAQGDAADLTGPGYALVRWNGLCLGVGWFRPAPGGGGSLRSLFPKRWAA